MDSPDNIDKLISSLNDIKKLKHKNEHKIKNKITKFSESYTQFKSSTEIMFCKLNELKNQIKKVEDDRTKFMDRFENQSNLIKKDKSKLETNSKMKSNILLTISLILMGIYYLFFILYLIISDMFVYMYED